MSEVKNNSMDDIRKLQKWLSIILLAVAVIMLFFNISSRIFTRIDLMSYKSVEGTISKLTEKKEIRNRKNSYTYYLDVDYEPYGEGSTLTTHKVFDVDYFFSQGEKVKVYFKNSDPDDTIIAKKIFFFYYPIVDGHNVALIAAIIIGGLGFGLLANYIDSLGGEESSKEYPKTPDGSPR